MFVRISMYVRSPTCVCMRVHVRMRVRVRARVCVCMCVCACVRMRAEPGQAVLVVRMDGPKCLQCCNAVCVGLPSEAQDAETLRFTMCERSRPLDSRRVEGGRYEPFANSLQHG